MARNPELAMLGPAWAGHAAGHYTLPPDLLAARTAHGVLAAAANTAAEAAIAVQPEAIEQDALVAVLEAATAGRPVLSDEPEGWRRAALECGATPASAGARLGATTPAR